MVEFITIPVHSDQWYSYRSGGIGASECASIMGLNEYECSLQLFHRKLNLLPNKEANLRMSLGTLSEPLISEIADYYERDKSKFLANIRNRTKVTHSEEVGAYATNSKYPNLFVSLDRRYKDSEGRYVIRELKNKSGMAYRKYQNELNVSEIIQISCQLLVTEYHKAELFYLIDNTSVELFTMTYKEALALESKISKAVKEFWAKVESARILLTKIYVAKSNFNMQLAQSLEQELYRLEPTDNSQAYLEYLTELSKTRKESIPLKGSSELLKKAQDLKKLEAKRKKIIEQETQIKAELSRTMREQGKHSIDFGKDGSVQLFGKFTNKVK